MRCFVRFLLTLAAVLAFPLSAYSAVVDVRTEGASAVVYVNRKAALSVRTPNAGLSAAARAQLAAKRIQQLAGSGAQAASIKAQGARRSATLYWGNQVIAVATRAEARAQSTTPAALASTWASQIRKLLSLPPVKMESRDMLVPLGESRRVELSGFSAGPFQLQVEPSSLATATYGPGSAVTVRAAQPGTGTLTVVTPDGSDRIPIAVRKYAGSLSEKNPQAQVTGSPVPADIVAEAAIRAARAACLLEPGATASVTLDSAARQMPSESASQGVPVTVKMEGPGLLNCRISTTIQVHRIAGTGPHATVLFYSNHPEQVLKPQQLYAAPLVPGQTARLLYHHQNGSNERMRVSITLANNSDQPASVHLIGALAEPRQDTVLVGYRAGARFLQDMNAGAGYVVQIPPQSRIVVWTGMLGKMDTASGIIQMRQTDSSADVVLRVLAEPASVYRTVQDITPTERGDQPSAFSVHQYPGPLKKMNEEYTAGSRWLFIRVGKQAIQDAAAERTLEGNYGVTYDIDLTLINPTQDARQVDVMFDATAGIAGIASMIDGQFAGKSHVTPAREYSLATFRLSPGERRQVRLSTVPLAGSNYPATIVVRS